MPWDVAVAGTVSLDDVTTPAGRRREQVGGSAVYFALAAARHAPVHLLGVVGSDGEAAVRATLAGARVDLAGLEVDPRATRRWRAVHDFERWVTASEDTDEGAVATWVPRVTPAAATAPVLFLGSMAPEQQLAVSTCSSAALVGVDSMVVHIEADRQRLWRVIDGADVLFINRGELSALTDAPEAEWCDVARALCTGHGRLRAVVVKAGPAGAACVTADAVLERDAHPVTPVVDPTGAGDALAGGFLGACAAAERLDAGQFAAALDAGVRCAADAIAGFGTTSLAGW